MRPSHPAGVVAMRKAPLDQRASLPEQALAIGPVHPPPVGVDGPLLLLLALPVPLPPLLLLRNIRSYFRPSFILVMRASGSCGFTPSWLLAFFFRWRSNRARSSRVGVSIPDSFAKPFRNSS